MEVSEIIDLIDMVDYVSQYIDLEQRGDEYWGLSPWTDERTPSFSVRPETKVFCDFSSGKSGNLVEFVIQYHSVDVRQAINMLKQYAHITEDEDGNVVHRLVSTKIAKRYGVKDRTQNRSMASALPDDYMTRFEFDKAMLKTWYDEGISWEVMNRFQVRYDRFDNRIVYPIRNMDGKIISVCGRTCDPDYKAKKIRKYTYQSKIGSLDTLYGFSDNLESIIDKGEMIVFEGAKSVMKAYDWGFDNAVALLTSHLSVQQFKYMIRFCNPNSIRIVFALDAEVNILADSNIQQLKKYTRVEWAKNRNNILEEKDSPVDKGVDNWKLLYSLREKLN